MFHGAVLYFGLPADESIRFARRMPSGWFLFEYWAVYACVALGLARGVNSLRWILAVLMALSIGIALIPVSSGVFIGPRLPPYHDYAVWFAHLAVVVLCFLPSAGPHFARGNRQGREQRTASAPLAPPAGVGDPPSSPADNRAAGP